MTMIMFRSYIYKNWKYCKLAYCLHIAAKKIIIKKNNLKISKICLLIELINRLIITYTGKQYTIRAYSSLSNVHLDDIIVSSYGQMDCELWQTMQAWIIN